MNQKDSPITISYTFNFKNQVAKNFDIELDPTTMFIIEDSLDTVPDWAYLSNFRCTNCTLNEKEHKYCPMAKNLSNVIEFFQLLPSFQEVSVSVESFERTTTKNTTVQIGVGSLLGIIMSSSGCPIVGRLRSLVRFHLPFASLEETEYRILSMYIVAQFIKLRQGKDTDWDLKKLKEAYIEIQKVNKNIVEKLSNVEMNDTSRNAVVTLSNFAEFILWSLEENELNHFEDFLRSFYEI